MKQINLQQVLKEVLFVVVIFGVVTVAHVAIKWSDSLYPSQTITVSAEGKTIVAPDIATVSFSVVSEGASPEKIQADNSKKMTDAINFVKGEGISADDIKTVDYSLSPRYEYDEDTHKTFISGYTLTQTARVKIRNLSKVAKIVGGLSETGVNRIGSVSFDIDEPDMYLDEARNEAFTKAHAKAQEMAAQNGVRIKRVLTFYEYRSGANPYAYEAFGKGGDIIEAAPLAPIEPGTEEITIQVNVTYEIK